MDASFTAKVDWRDKFLQFFGTDLVKTYHIAARALLWALIGLGLAITLFIVRLNAGPIELGWLQPRIERALTPENSPVAVDAGRIELRLNDDKRTLELVGVDVRYQASEDNTESLAPLVAFPEVELALSVEALLKRGMIAASSVHATAPALVVTRNRDGVIDLSLDADEDGNANGVDLSSLLRRFVEPSAEDGRLVFLESLQISGGRVAFYDRLRTSAFTTNNADLTLSRRDGGVDGWLRADILQESVGPASVQISGRITPGSDQLPFEIDIADLMPADLSVIWPLVEPSIPSELAGVRLPVRASIRGDIGLDGTLSPLAVDVQAAGGVIDVPGHLAKPLEIGKAELKGTIAGDFGAMEIEHAAIVSRGALLSGSGRVVWRDDEPTLALDLEAQDVRVDDLSAFWPPDLGVDAREWVVENMTAGIVSKAEAKLDLLPDDFGPDPLRDDAVGGSFDFDGLSVRYIDEMPPLENASGRAVFDADRMQFDVEGGTNEGVSLKDGSVTITGMGKPGRLATQLRVLADAEGTVEEVLALLDYPPLEIATELGISPSATAGSVVTSLAVSLPLHEAVTEDEAVVLAEASLSDLAIDRLPKLDGEVGLDRGTFSLTVDEDAVRLDGTAEANGIPLAINVIEPLEDDDSATRRIGLSGSLSRDQLDAEGIPLDGLDGAFEFEATVTETETHFWIDLEADLRDLAINPSGLAWSKPAGQEGLLRASAAMPLDGPLAIKQFDLTTGDLETSGTLTLLPSNDGLASLSLDKFRLADSDATIRVTPDGAGGYEVVIEAARLNIDTVFGEDREVSDGFERFHVVLSADQIRARGIELIDVKADAQRQEDGWRTASVIGTLPSNGKLALELTPDGDDRQLVIRSENAGAMIQALDLGRRIEGGNLLLSARLRSQDPVIADGRFEITDFVLLDAPLLARMLTLASLTGIGNLLEGEGIRVDHLILPFALNDQSLTLTDGLMRGSQIGLTVKGGIGLESETMDLAGTIIPVYTLNRLIGQVPVIGRILTGVDGRGAFAATYSLSGPHDDPAVYVNPLSLLTPGLLRDFVGGLINGTLDPPDLRETDD